MNSEEGRSKGFGFVSFEEAEQVKALNKFITLSYCYLDFNNKNKF